MNPEVLSTTTVPDDGSGAMVRAKLVKAYELVLPEVELAAVTGRRGASVIVTELVIPPCRSLNC